MRESTDTLKAQTVERLQTMRGATALAAIWSFLSAFVCIVAVAFAFWIQSLGAADDTPLPRGRLEMVLLFASVLPCALAALGFAVLAITRIGKARTIGCEIKSRMKPA